jgi:predicted nucleotidyltransferase
VAGHRVGAPIRQQRILDALVGRIALVDGLDGAILIGSLAEDTADAASDVDLFVCVRPGRFDEAWSQRHRLHVTGSLVAWDDRAEPEVGVHRWVTDDVVLVEALFATPTSGARLAPPWRILVGAADLADRFPRRPPIDRGEMSREGSHPIDVAFDDLKKAVRRHGSA